MSVTSVHKPAERDWWSQGWNWEVANGTRKATGSDPVTGEGHCWAKKGDSGERWDYPGQGKKNLWFEKEESGT